MMRKESPGAGRGRGNTVTRRKKSASTRPKITSKHDTFSKESLPHHSWQYFGEEFRQLDEKMRGFPLERRLRLYCSYKSSLSDEELIQQGKWDIDGNPGGLRETFRLRASQAGMKLSSPRFPKPLELWLYNIYRYALKNHWDRVLEFQDIGNKREERSGAFVTNIGNVSAALCDSLALTAREQPERNVALRTDSVQQPMGSVEWPRKFQTRDEFVKSKLPSASRSSLINRYIDEVLKRTGKKITRSDIWRCAGYKTRTEFEKWQRNDPKKVNKSAADRFGRILSEKPHLK